MYRIAHGSGGGGISGGWGYGGGSVSVSNIFGALELEVISTGTKWQVLHWWWLIVISGGIDVDIGD